MSLHILDIGNLSFSVPFVFYTNFFLTIGSLALFIEAAIVLRALVLGRSPLARYLLLALPLGASILTFIVAMYGWQTYSYTDWQGLESSLSRRLAPSAWNAIQLRINNLTSAAIVGLLQSILVITLFALTLFLEKKLLPRVHRPPLWTAVRRQRII